MTVLSAQTIQGYADAGRSLVAPFCPRQVSNGMTFGLGPAGYDIRAAEDCAIVSGGFRLGSSIEYFDLPIDVLAYVKDKSSWARKGICVQNTVLEPGWRGFLTLEYTNHSKETILIQMGDPIAQIVFHRLDMPTIQPYRGKYQDQPAGPQKVIHEERQDWRVVSVPGYEWIVEMDFSSRKTMQPRYRHKKVGDSDHAWRTGKPDAN